MSALPTHRLVLLLPVDLEDSYDESPIEDPAVLRELHGVRLRTVVPMIDVPVLAAAFTTDGERWCTEARERLVYDDATKSVRLELTFDLERHPDQKEMIRILAMVARELFISSWGLNLEWETEIDVDVFVGAQLLSHTIEPIEAEPAVSTPAVADLTVLRAAATRDRNNMAMGWGVIGVLAILALFFAFTEVEHRGLVFPGGAVAIVALLGALLTVVRKNEALVVLEKSPERVVWIYMTHLSPGDRVQLTLGLDDGKTHGIVLVAPTDQEAAQRAATLLAPRARVGFEASWDAEFRRDPRAFTGGASTRSVKQKRVGVEP